LGRERARADLGGELGMPVAVEAGERVFAIAASLD
jgi:hypothetical protein